jgi:P4 family phage/plasmid primase-like protien
MSDTRRRNSYLDIGKALHSYYRGGDRGLRLWLSYVDPSLRDKCTLLYRYKFNVNPITVKTVAWFVLSDDIERYKQWHTRWFDEAFQMSIRQPTGSNVAATMYRYYWLHLLTDANGRWWYFNGTRWINDDTKVRHLIYYDFQRLYTEHRRQVERSNVINKREQIKNIDDILVMLNRYNTNVIKYLADMLYDPNFNVYCDAIPSVIGLVDDVIEVSKTGVVVRKGKPEDYIVRSTGVRWDYNMTWEHPLVQDCLTWFRQLFPDPEETELREYFLRVMASILRAGNKEKALYIMYGKKDGAKSTVKRLLELTLGEYSHTFSTASFMGKSSNGPSPDMALAKGTLVDFIQEPDEADQLRNGLIKMLTGNDSYFGRMLYQNGGRIQPTFKLFLMCNKIPIIPSSDEALKERLVIIPFTSRWTHDAPKDVAEQYRLRRFPIDPDFEDEKLPLLAPAMLWLMVQYYPVYLTKGALVRPEKVTRSIQAYWDDNDLYSHFQRDCIIQDDKYITPIRNVYEHFKSWHTRSLPGHRIPTLIQFKEEMRLRLGFSGNNAWPVKLINDTN